MRKIHSLEIIFLALYLPVLVSCSKQIQPYPVSAFLLTKVFVGAKNITPRGSNTGCPIDSLIIMEFNIRLDTATVRNNIVLKSEGRFTGFAVEYFNNFTGVRLILNHLLDNHSRYTLQILSGLKGFYFENFSGAEYNFTTINGQLSIDNITINGAGFQLHAHPRNIDRNSFKLEIFFSQSLDTSNYKSFFSLSNNFPVFYSISTDNKKVTITNTADLAGYTRYYFNISSNLKSKNGLPFGGFTNFFYTALDSTLKFPPISDDQLLTLVQQQTFRYFHDFSHPACGMARERNISSDVVTMGGSGFGVMALIVGMSRGFITRSEGLAQFSKILNFLETCDRFHGAWPHWLNGNTGKVVPFGVNDDGADLVETTYMIMGLLTMRQYLDSTTTNEKLMIGRINVLAGGVEYDWFTRGQNVLYWNWSPDYGWAINVKVQGYNETLITYVIAASSTTHPVSAAVYHQGYAANGAIMNGKSFYGYLLPLGEDYGGPLFFTQYTYLGLDPRALSDMYANYWTQNVNQSLINYTYCVHNPKNYIGYNAHSWGLTASDNPWGYSAHSPTNDLGVISPTAAVSALPYTPVQSMNAIRHFYYILGDRLWGDYGFYDAFDVTEGWWANSYIAIDEGPIVGMIENYRTQLLWNLFMSCPEIKQSLTKLSFTY
jgi:hypothetical protein